MEKFIDFRKRAKFLGHIFCSTNFSKEANVDGILDSDLNLFEQQLELEQQG